MFRARVALALPLLAACYHPPANSQCLNPPEVKKLTDPYGAPELRALPEAERRAAQRKILDTAMAEFPTNSFVLERQLDWFDNNTAEGHDAAIAYFAALRQKYPHSLEVTALYADALRNRDSAQALQILTEAKQAHPDNSYLHYKLFTAFSGKLRGTPRLAEGIEAYLKVCPAPNNANAYRVMMSQGATEQTAHHAGLLRTRLEAEAGEPNQRLWPALWDLEFKAVPTAQHPAIRERIGAESDGDHGDQLGTTLAKV